MVSGLRRGTLSPLQGKVCRTEPEPVSSQRIDESKGRGLPVGPLASHQTAEHAADPPAVMLGELRSHPARAAR